MAVLKNFRSKMRSRFLCRFARRAKDERWSAIAVRVDHIEKLKAKRALKEKGRRVARLGIGEHNGSKGYRPIVRSKDVNMLFGYVQPTCQVKGVRNRS